MPNERHRVPASARLAATGALLRPPAFALIAAALLLLAGRPAVCQAETAYAWANDPTRASYQPVPDYAYNPTGGAIEITHPAGGSYRVRFAGMTLHNGNVQVTAYGDDNRYCKVASWGGDTVSVRCFDNWGAPADARFAIRFSTTPDFHAWANDPTSARYTPSSTYANPFPTAGRIGIGRYWMVFSSGAGYMPGVFHVTAYGSDNRRCRVGGWVSGWGGGVPMPITRCFDPRQESFGEYSTDADAQYTALFVSASATRQVAYAWANEPTSLDYTPALAHNPAGGAVRVSGARGAYSVRFAGMNLRDGNVQVTATTCANDRYGWDDCRCKVRSWGGEAINVLCFGNDGRPAGAGFTVSFTR